MLTKDRFRVRLKGPILAYLQAFHHHTRGSSRGPLCYRSANTPPAPDRGLEHPDSGAFLRHRRIIGDQHLKLAD